MIESEKRSFAEVLISIMNLHEKQISADSIEIWFSVLEKYELSDIILAFKKHLSDEDSGRFAPLPAHIIANIPKPRGLQL